MSDRAGPSSPAAWPTGAPRLRFDTSGAAPCFRFPLVEAVPGVRHAFTTRLGGRSRGAYATMNLGLSVGDDREAVLENRARGAALVAREGVHPVTVRQMHGVAAAVASAPGEPGKPIADADMLATATAGIAIMAQAADCLPVVLVDPERPAVAVVHAGWRGAAARAGREAVASMGRLFGSRPESLLAGIGPAIGVCCYEVGDDVAKAVAAACRSEPPSLVDRSRGERPYLDLEAAFVQQLLDAGMRSTRIAAAHLCTACNLELFYSHRREGTPSGRFGVVAALSG